jgi:Ras-related GTP-binding protein C/D
MLDFFITAYQENPTTTLEVFVHKAESLAEDYKTGMWSHDTILIPSGISPYHLRSCYTSVGPRPPGCLRAFSHTGTRLMLISENFRHIQQRVIDELFDTSQEYEQMPVSFHLTSVYDHSIREGFSRVLHKLIDSLPYLEDLLNVFCSVSTISPLFRH